MEARFVIAALNGRDVVDERENTFGIVLGVADCKFYLDFALVRAFQFNVLYCRTVLRLVVQRNAVAVQILYEVDKTAVVFEGPVRAGEEVSG